MTGWPMTNDLAKLLIVLGGLLVVAGGVLLVTGRIPSLGRLPGDVTVRWGGGSFHFPIVTCLLVSLLLSLVLSFFRR